jgi:hypothetical protein
MIKLPHELNEKILEYSGYDVVKHTNLEYLKKHCEKKLKQNIVVNWKTFRYLKENKYVDREKYTIPDEAIERFKVPVGHNIKSETFPDLPNDEKDFININMMPWIIGQESTSIPKKYHRYLDLINNCVNGGKCNINFSLVSILLKGCIGYLTIHESFAKKGYSQRRPGLHVDSSRIMCDQDNQVQLAGTYSWGGGLLGGIIIGSNIPESFEVYPCEIKDIGVGKHGDVEDYRDFLPPRILNKKNTLSLMTDHTPHASLPMKEDCVRQFFRIVVGDVDVWYRLHSTENELGILPDSSTRIIETSKFNQ